MGEAEHLRQRPGLEARAVHPVRKLRDGVPARHDSRALLRRSMAGQRARRFRVCPPGRPRVSQPALHAPGGRRGLHRVRALRRGVPRAKSRGRRDPRHQHGGEGTDPRAGTQEPRVLRHAPRQQARGAGCGAGAGRSVLDAALRVLRRVCRLWRNALPATPHAALRRPFARGQCDRLFVHLRGQSAHDALVGQQAGSRAGLGEFALRGQRRVRARVPAVTRQAARGGGAPAREAGATARAGARSGTARRAAGQPGRTSTRSEIASRRSSRC